MRYRDRNKNTPSSDTAHVSGAKLTIRGDLHGGCITPRFTLMLSISSNIGMLGTSRFLYKETDFSSTVQQSQRPRKP